MHLLTDKNSGNQLKQFYQNLTERQVRGKNNQKQNMRKL